MQTVWRVGGHAKLVLFFSGWAMDENPTAHLLAHDADICTCFDYRTLETADVGRWKSYQEIILVAWSTGVWVAEQVVGKSDLSITLAIAINGTATTVHDETGIPRAVFQGTYEQLSEKTMSKFQRRMVGSRGAFSEFSGMAPRRKLEEQKAELETILNVDFNAVPTELISWNKAIIGTADAIFPPQNQLRYWASRCEIVELELPHFPFFYFKSWIIIC
jgi:pimeloyl-[acyl-carrier protein] methyl ester esterase